MHICVVLLNTFIVTIFRYEGNLIDESNRQIYKKTFEKKLVILLTNHLVNLLKNFGI
jgi:hypothetical protein